MSSTPTMQNNWADVSTLDVDTEKMLNSFLNDSTSANPDTRDGAIAAAIKSNNSFASPWPDSVQRSLSDNAPLFGLSPSANMGVSPGLAGLGNEQGDPTKPSNSWSLPSEFGTGIATPSSGMSSMCRTLSDAMPHSMSNDSYHTGSDTQNMQDGMMQSFGTASSSMPFEDMIDYNDQKDPGSTPQLSPASVMSQPSPSMANNTLSGYHTNIASDHAHHLADLVKASSILNAGHPGPRSLATSLSRSVLNADAIGRPDASMAAPQSKGLTIQQRRRLSHMDQSPSSIDASHDTQVSPKAHPTPKGRRRQNSAPDPVFPALASSPEMPGTPLERQRRTPRGSGSADNTPVPRVVGLPAIEGDAASWSDAVVSNSHDLVFVLSLKGTVLYMSPSVQRILGFSPEEIIGRPLVDFSHPADIGPFSRELKEAITLPNGDDEGSDAENFTAVKAHRRVDLIMRMARKDGNFSLIETTGRVSVDPPKHRKVVVCSGRPHSIPMLPWNDVRQDLLTSELSAWLKISHNGIFLGATGPIQQILGIEDVTLLGRHVRDLPMVTSSSDLLDALRSGRCISVQDHYEAPDTAQKLPVKLTVYPWTSNGRSNAVSFVHVQQRSSSAAVSESSQQPSSVLTKRKMSEREPDSATQEGSGSLSGSAMQADGLSVPVMTASDAANTVFSELTGFHSGSWLIEMQKLHNANRRLRHELTVLRKRSSSAKAAAPAAAAC